MLQRVISILKKKTLKDYLVVLFGTGFSRGIAFINSVIIARLLGPEDFGRFSMFFVVMVLTWMFAQSFDSAFIRYAKTSRDNAEKTEFLKISFLLKITYGIIITIFSYPMSYFMAHFVFKKPEVTSLIIFALLSGIFQSFLMTIASIFQEKENFTAFSFLYSFYTVSILLLLIVVKLSGFPFDLESVVFIHLFVSLAIGIASIYLLFGRKIKRIFPLNRDYLRKSLVLGKWIFGINIMMFVFSRMDFLYLGRYLNFNSLGVYSVSQQIVMIISVMVSSSSGIFLPKACSALESKIAFKRFCKEAVFIALIINIIIGALIIFVPILIKALYGTPYMGAVILTRILLIGWMANVFYSPFSFLFYAADESALRFVLEAAKLIIAVLLLAWLVPYFKSIGAALAITITFVVTSFISLIILKYKIDYRHNLSD